MKRLVTIFSLLIFLSITISGIAFSNNITIAIKEGMKTLNIKKSDPNLSVLTNVSYVKLNGKTTEKYVDLIQEITGCSIGKGNLLFFHRPTSYPLKIVLFRKDTKDSVVITYKGNDQDIKMVKINIDGEKATIPKYWKKLEASLGRSDAFSIVTILNAWEKGAPYDFLKCCEFHNHLCPGVTSGYFIVSYILKKYPLKKGEKYIFIACPPWCKDDAIQILLDLTPGKRSLFVKQLSSIQKKDLPEGIAGILVKWNNKEKKGKGVVFQFNRKKAYEEIGGVKIRDFKPKGGKSNPLFWTTRIKVDWALMPYLNKPEMFISTIKEFNVTYDKLIKLTLAGVNPYNVIGLTSKH
ncbi:MAG: hypothetical protein JRI44_08660 [Deltaproteobacteria bacterium]|nr:hypothetical protein [Deltaproteobacteria bacterium]